LFLYKGFVNLIGSGSGDNEHGKNTINKFTELIISLEIVVNYPQISILWGCWCWHLKCFISNKYGIVEKEYVGECFFS
jgi:hypothetical protein